MVFDARVSIKGRAHWRESEGTDQITLNLKRGFDETACRKESQVEPLV